jgi:hypothetical protein
MNGARWTAMLGMAVLLASLPALTGCGRKTAEQRAEALAERIASAASGQKVDLDPGGKTVRVEGKGVKAELKETAEWPTGMFADVPRFTFGTVTHVSQEEEGGMKKFNVFLARIEPGGLKRYAELLRQRGWETNVMDMGPKGGMLNGQKGQLAMNFVYNNESNDGTLAVYSLPK